MQLYNRKESTASFDIKKYTLVGITIYIPLSLSKVIQQQYPITFLSLLEIHDDLMDLQYKYFFKINFYQSVENQSLIEIS